MDPWFKSDKHARAYIDDNSDGFYIEVEDGSNDTWHRYSFPCDAARDFFQLLTQDKEPTGEIVERLKDVSCIANSEWYEDTFKDIFYDADAYSVSEVEDEFYRSMFQSRDRWFSITAKSDHDGCVYLFYRDSRGEISWAGCYSRDEIGEAAYLFSSLVNGTCSRDMGDEPLHSIDDDVILRKLFWSVGGDLCHYDYNGELEFYHPMTDIGKRFVGKVSVRP